MAQSEPSRTAPELWGGVECTVNRVGDRFFDQLERSGHDIRADDLDLFAALGVSALRYPVLWERTAPAGLESADWSWPRERLARLRDLGVTPIVGFLHHGSGPRYTSLTDPAFADKLADYARAFAERFPWVESYTPVNEPLTTARFSGLYGHWYPHGRDALTFARAMLSECRGVVLSMRAIREINPAARLVQTEDLGKTCGARSLAYQADFENERRWLTFDLLCGRVDRFHPMRSYLLWAGVEEREVDWFLENRCEPDIVGINHYLTSERFLDERVDLYPACLRGGNGRHEYADVEAVRVLAEGVAGPRRLLKEAWDRYNLPVAVTEAHLGCTREEQMRWLMEMWDAARALGQDGVDVRAITAWALLGAFDWNALLTRQDGYYEPGVFDLRALRPRATALARMVRDLVEAGDHDHPVLDTPGWWRRPERLTYTAERRNVCKEASRAKAPWMKSRSPRPLLITGATGTLGNGFARLCEERGISYRLLSRRDMDISVASSVAAALDELKPWAVINTAGYVRVDDAEIESETCFRENTVGAATLAACCAEQNVSLVTFSSDLVFDGAKDAPYVESDEVNPLAVYGRSKAEAEAQVLAILPSSLVIRTSAFFGPWDEHNFVTIALGALMSGQRFIAACDATVSPTYVPDLVHASLDLLVDGERGIWHLSNAGAITWSALARRAAELAGCDASLVDARPLRALGLTAKRPAYSALATERAWLMPSLEDALSRYVNARRSMSALPIEEMRLMASARSG
ncbi:MAG TPA: family 1 glycosylhydrolase [Blastocatellia bacterium]|nr:family 1 glycosylhydrolase [Blastocatellia bacterium]